MRRVAGALLRALATPRFACYDLSHRGMGSSRESVRSGFRMVSGETRAASRVSPAAGPDGEPMDQPVAVITGAGRGIGRATAVALARLGYRLALASRTPAELAETIRLSGA